MFRDAEMVEKNSQMSLIFYVLEEMIIEGTEKLWNWAATGSWDCFEV